MTEQETKEMLDAMKGDKEGGRKKFWSVPSKFEGTKIIRFLPPLKKLNERVFYYKHYVHWLDGTPYESLDQDVYDTKGNLIHRAEQDPVQTFVKKLFKTSARDSDEWELAKKIAQKERYVSRIIVRDESNPENELTPQFYEYGPAIFNIVYHIITESEYGNIIDPKTGRDFLITKKGQGRQSKYEGSLPSANPSMIFEDPQKIKTVFEKAEKMIYTDLFEMPSYEQKKDALNKFLGVGEKTQTNVPENPISTNKEEEKTEDTAPVDTTSSEPSEESSEIDDILNEFTS